jgi:DNA-directed RNA polymerase subunit RPC12/RpoP
VLTLREPTARDWWATAGRVALFVALLVAAFALRWWWAAAVVLVLGLALLVRWHASSFGYRCPNCGAEFRATAAADLVGLNWPRSGHPAKWLRCPRCGRRSLIRVLAVHHPA